MVLTNDRAEKLSAYLTADIERAKGLIELSPEEAAAKINADGFDFTAEEIKEFGDELQKVAAVQSEGGELSEDALSAVAGGIGPITGALIALGAGILIGGMDRFKIW